MLQLLFLSSKCGLPLAVSEATIPRAQESRKMSCWGISVLTAAVLCAAVISTAMSACGESS